MKRHAGPDAPAGGAWVDARLLLGPVKFPAVCQLRGCSMCHAAGADAALGEQGHRQGSSASRSAVPAAAADPLASRLLSTWLDVIDHLPAVHDAAAALRLLGRSSGPHLVKKNKTFCARFLPKQ